MISVVMLTRNRFEMLKYSIELLREQFQYVEHEIIIVNTESNDGSTEWLLAQYDIYPIIVSSSIKNNTWAYLINLAFKHAKGEWIFMLSDDTFICPNLVENMLEHLPNAKDDIGVIAFPFHDLYGNPDGVYKIFKLWGIHVLNHGLYRKSALQEIGYADEETFNEGIYGADTDICFMMYAKGYQLGVFTNCRLIHDIRSHNHAVTDGTIRPKITKNFQMLIDKWKHTKAVPEGMTVEETSAEEVYIKGDMPSHIIERLNKINNDRR